MKWQVLSAAVLAGAVSAMVGCQEPKVANVIVPTSNDASAYRPVAEPKPLPPNGYTFGGVPQPAPYPGQSGVGPAPGQPLTVSPNPSIENEDAFVAAYAKRNPRIMIFVNRTIQGDPLPKDGLDEVLRVEKTQSATGAVSVNNNSTVTGSGQTATALLGGSSASNTNVNRTDSSSFTSGGPASYTSSTVVKKPTDKLDMFGASADDYEMIESSLVQYFDNSGKVQVKDSDAARAKLNREQILRVENGDPTAAQLLGTELQADVLIRVTAKPTVQSGNGGAIRLIAKAVTTTDARNLGSAMVDMPLPMSKPNINVYTRYLAGKLMGQMALKWAQPAEYDPIEVRIYKAASIDDSGKIASWIKPAPGVKSVDLRQATAGGNTSYAVIAVGFEGSPWMLYQELKDGIGMSTGIKAVDLSNNTINLEITGPMNLVTTTRHVESTTTIETRTTEERRIDTVNPAGPQN
jgi:hypothetical protein